MNTAISYLEIYLTTLVTNEPINRAAGKTEQAELEASSAAEIRAAIQRLKGEKALPSLYQIGDRVRIPDLCPHAGVVAEVHFTEDKVRYDVVIDTPRIRIDNVDSLYLVPEEAPPAQDLPYPACLRCGGEMKHTLLESWCSGCGFSSGTGGRFDEDDPRDIPAPVTPHETPSDIA